MKIKYFATLFFLLQTINCAAEEFHIDVVRMLEKIRACSELPHLIHSAEKLVRNYDRNSNENLWSIPLVFGTLDYLRHSKQQDCGKAIVENSIDATTWKLSRSKVEEVNVRDKVRLIEAKFILSSKFGGPRYSFDEADASLTQIENEISQDYSAIVYTYRSLASAAPSTAERAYQRIVDITLQHHPKTLESGLVIEFENATKNLRNFLEPYESKKLEEKLVDLWKAHSNGSFFIKLIRHHASRSEYEKAKFYFDQKLIKIQEFNSIIHNRFLSDGNLTDAKIFMDRCKDRILFSFDEVISDLAILGHDDLNEVASSVCNQGAIE